MYERGKKHMSEIKGGVQTNCTVIHNKVHHGASTEMNFRMEAVEKFASSMDRQLDESLRIRYNPIPRAVFK